MIGLRYLIISKICWKQTSIRLPWGKPDKISFELFKKRGKNNDINAHENPFKIRKEGKNNDEENLLKIIEEEKKEGSEEEEEKKKKEVKKKRKKRKKILQEKVAKCNQKR